MKKFQKVKNDLKKLVKNKFWLDDVNSSLNNITAYKLHSNGITLPCISRMSTSSNLTSDKSTLHFVYPDLMKNSKNFDPTNLFTQNITFIAMNFQSNDSNLLKYNTKFQNSSIILQ